MKRSEPTPRCGIRDTSGDWPEDFSLENGNYLCHCLDCGRSFMGYKRRVTCKVCALQPAPATSGEPPISLLEAAEQVFPNSHSMSAEDRREFNRINRAAASGEPSDEALIATLANGTIGFYLGQPDVFITVKDRHDEAVRMVEARLAALRAEVEAGRRERQAWLRTAADRFELLLGRFRACDAVVDGHPRHVLSFEDCEEFIAEYRAALSTPTSGASDGRQAREASGGGRSTPPL